MSDKWRDLPRDLRTLCGGLVKDADGTVRLLFHPIRAYANVTAVIKLTKSRLSDPRTCDDEKLYLKSQLEFLMTEKKELKDRILGHYVPCHSACSPKNQNHRRSRLDHGAKSKLEKAVADIDAETFNRWKPSKPMQAVLTALSYRLKNGQMPSCGELKKLGFNDHEVTLAGRWLVAKAPSSQNPKSIFLPLRAVKRGRPKK